MKPILLSKISPESIGEEEWIRYFDQGSPDCQVIEYMDTPRATVPAEIGSANHLLVDVMLPSRVYNWLGLSDPKTLEKWLKGKRITVINPKRDQEGFVLGGGTYNIRGILDKRPLLDYEDALTFIFKDLELKGITGVGHAYHEWGNGFVARPYDKASGRFGDPVPIDDYLRRVEEEFFL